MPTTWYYQSQNGSFGPISSADLKLLAENGEITPKTTVRKGSDGGWVPATKVKGLFLNEQTAVPQPPPIQAKIVPSVPSSNALPIIKPNELPEDVRQKLQHDENVHHFGYIDSQGGCSNPSTAKQWLLITNRRILFEASVKQGTGNTAQFVHQSGSIPMAKVSYVGTSTSQQLQGCANVAATNLAINSSGGEIILAIPTKQEAERAQAVIDAIISQTT